MLTRQKTENLQLIRNLQNEISAMKYERNVGVFAFIFIHSCLFTLCVYTDMINVSALHFHAERIHMAFSLLNTFDKSVAIAVYHFVVYKAICNRAIISIITTCCVVAHNMFSLHHEITDP